MRCTSVSSPLAGSRAARAPAARSTRNCPLIVTSPSVAGEGSWPNGTNPRVTSRSRPSSRRSGTTRLSPARPFCERFTTRIVSSSMYVPRAVTDCHSWRSASSLVLPAGSRSAISTGAASQRCSTVALKSRRSSRRRNCHRPRFTIATAAVAMTRWKAIHRGVSANRYIASDGSDVGAGVHDEAGTGGQPSRSLRG